MSKGLCRSEWARIVGAGGLRRPVLAPDVLRLLESIPGTSDPKRVRARLFRSMRRDLTEDETKLQRITRILFQMAVDGDSPTPKAEAEMFGFDDAVELAAGGVLGNIGAVRREVLTFLDRWEQ